MTNPTQLLTLIQHPDNAEWGAVVKRFWRERPKHARHGLTESEHVLIEHLARGKPMKETAFALGISEKAARKHLHTIRRVLRVHPIPEILRVYFAGHEDALAQLRGETEEREAA